MLMLKPSLKFVENNPSVYSVFDEDKKFLGIIKKLSLSGEWIFNAEELNFTYVQLRRLYNKVYKLNKRDRKVKENEPNI